MDRIIRLIQCVRSQSWYLILSRSLGAIVLLIFWMYISYRIILYGAHLAAAVEYVLIPIPEDQPDAMDS